MLAFQDKTLTWVKDRGLVRRGPENFQLTFKPDLGFPFDNVYAEETHAFKVIDDKQIPLSEPEIEAVTQWIDTQDPSMFQRVLGVDENGKYLGECLPSAAFKVVRSSPPTADNWRFDFAAESWQYVHGVDADGRYIGNTVPGTAAAEAPSGPPDTLRDWRFRNGAWVDETTVEAAQGALLADLKRSLDVRLETGVTHLQLGDQTLSFGLDAETRENILSVTTAITAEKAGLLPAGTVPNPRPYTPKGSTQPLAFPHETLVAVGNAIFAAKQGYMDVYFAHKAAIKALNDRNAVDAYDLSTGWPA